MACCIDHVPTASPTTTLSGQTGTGLFFRSLHDIKVEVNGHNQRANRLYERLGCRLAGRIRWDTPVDGNRYGLAPNSSRSTRASCKVARTHRAP
jgi:ribosomal protein S18 acetylase RimI-like enzyme